jgi:hypothetical protein
MAKYTWAELKDLTSVPSVATFSEAKCTVYQATAEAILAGLNLNTSIAGYSDAYAGAVILLFDTIAENPTGLRASSAGKVSKTFSVDDLPGSVQILVRPYISGEGGTLAGASMQRNDMGMR